MIPKNNYQNAEQDRRIIELENHWIKLNEEFGDIKTDVGKIKTNLEWLIKTYWIVTTASVGALVGALINLLLR